VNASEKAVQLSPKCPRSASQELECYKTTMTHRFTGSFTKPQKWFSGYPV